MGVWDMCIVRVVTLESLEGCAEWDCQRLVVGDELAGDKEVGERSGRTVAGRYMSVTEELSILRR